MSDRPLAFLGVPFDGAATLGWPGARYAPEEVRRNLEWMKMRVEDGHIYWIDRDEVVPFSPDRLRDAGDAAVVPHDLMATLVEVRRHVAELATDGAVPVVVGGDDSTLFPAVAGVHDASAGSVAVVHFDAHLDLTDGNPGRVVTASRAGCAAPSSWSGSIQSAVFRWGPATSTFRRQRRSSTRWGSPRSRRHGSSPMACQRRLQPSTASPVALIGSSSRSMSTCSIRHMRQEWDGTNPVVSPPGNCSTSWWRWRRADGWSFNEVNPMTDARSQTSILAANLIFQVAVASGL